MGAVGCLSLDSVGVLPMSARLPWPVEITHGLKNTPIDRRPQPKHTEPVHTSWADHCELCGELMRWVYGKWADYIGPEKVSVPQSCSEAMKRYGVSYPVVPAKKVSHEKAEGKQARD